MNKKEKQEYLIEYQIEKDKGVPFFPDIIFKDAVVSLTIFLALLSLAFFIGAPLEEKANPLDISYIPRPEWYFLFLFQLLKYFPGKLEIIGVVVLPTIMILILFALPFIDHNKHRHYKKRKVVIVTTSLVVVGVVALTILAIIGV
jgi:ubiquinol-cytochrome c reductase cytochrome b subunit